MAAQKRDQTQPANALEALERARLHTRRAGVELIAAAHAVLDAASLGWSGQPSAENATLRTLASGLDELGDRLERGDATLPQPVARLVLTALDEEIARWQQRSETDRDARAVLRAFLSIREILWEIGFRRADPHAGTQRDAALRKAEDAHESAEHGGAGADSRAQGAAPTASKGSGRGARQSGATAPRVRRLSRVKEIRDEG